MDIDLAILGTEASTCDVCEAAVPKEYAFVPWPLYREKRAEVLWGFLDRQQIYTSGCLPQSFEERARQNLSLAIDRLTNSSG